MPNKISGLHLWLVLHKAYKAVETQARNHVEYSMALCLSDFAVMEVLLHKGPMRVNEIGQQVMLTSGSITTAIQRLEHIGYLEKTVSAKDSRARLIDLNPIGRKFIERQFSAHETVMEKAASVLTQAERQQLETLLKKWGKSLEEEED